MNYTTYSTIYHQKIFYFHVFRDTTSRTTETFTPSEIAFLYVLRSLFEKLKNLVECLKLRSPTNFPARGQSSNSSKTLALQPVVSSESSSLPSRKSRIFTNPSDIVGIRTLYSLKKETYLHSIPAPPYNRAPAKSPNPWPN